jgi:hypothetical protein
MIGIAAVRKADPGSLNFFQYSAQLYLAAKTWEDFPLLALKSAIYFGGHQSSQVGKSLVSMESTMHQENSSVAQGQKEQAERVLSKIILPTSGTMIGVCATIIGLVKVVERNAQSSHVDEYTALVMMLFLVSSIASYLSIRRADRRGGGLRLELVADVFFLSGLVAISTIGLFFAYEII